MDILKDGTEIEQHHVYDTGFLAGKFEKEFEDSIEVRITSYGETVNLRFEATGEPITKEVTFRHNSTPKRS